MRLMDRDAGPRPAETKGRGVGPRRACWRAAFGVLAMATASRGLAQSPQAQSGGEDGQGVNQTSYALRAGETLSVVAQRFGVALSELIAANEIDDSNQVRAGKRLAIPRGQRKKSAKRA